MFLKICGIRNEAEARAAVDCGATALGFLVGLTHRAEDGVDEHKARAIVQSLPRGIESVMVTHLLDAGAIAGLADAIGVRAVQVQDDLPVEQMRHLGLLLPGRRLIKAVHVTGPEAIRHAQAHRGVAQALLLDSRTPERLGGTGRTHDWSISRTIVQSVAPLPLYLAGGLRPGNVEAAIRAVRPAGVDVNSGVETADGAKDPSAMRAFLGKATVALSALRDEGAGIP